MLVKDWMSTKVVTIDARDTVQVAINLLLDNDISMLPVMEDGKLVGVVTDRDLKRVSPSDACLLDFQNIMYHVARIEVGTVMAKSPVTVPPDFTLEETAEILLHNKISSAPVVSDEGQVLGIITKDDLFAALMALTGVSQRGILFGFELEDRPGTIKEVTDIIRRYGERLVSIVSTYETAAEGFRHVYVRAFNVDRDTLPQLEQELRDKAKLLYMIDHKEHKSTFYNS
jgi:acetoin utilization protein AcuB